MNTEPLLAVEGLVVRYGTALALAGFDITVAAGSVLAVVGPNGTGKSTLARALSGLVPAAEGRIRFNGKDITRWEPHRIRRAGLVHLPEGRGVFTGLTVAENLRMAAAELPRRRRPAAIQLGYEIFPALASRRRQAAGTLSGGEQQMLSLARGLVVQPRLIIADEISLGLAPKMVDVVFDGLRRARAHGAAIVLVEQYVHRALSLADTCAIVSRGAVAWSGPAAEAKDEVLRRYLGSEVA
jgi:branched-chain amino acid transport system ATP-binding protein